MRKFKICQLASADISLRFLLLEFMAYLGNAGFEVWGVSSPGKWVRELRQKGISFFPVPITRKIFTPLADIAALCRLYFFFRREKFHIVHTHTPKASFLGQVAAFLARVPVRIYTIHGLYFQKESSWQKKLIFWPIEKIIAKIVHRAFSVNREDVEFLLREKIYTPEKILYIGGGVDVEKFNPERFSQEMVIQKKRELGISADTKIIGIVARLVKEKGFFPLFAAFAKLQTQFPDILLLIVGPKDTEKRDALDLRVVQDFGIASRTMFLGERVDMPELYSVMDIFTLPSFREGLGLSLVEASSMAKPVVASDIRGCREVVEHGKTGLLVPSNDPEKLAEAFRYMLSRPEEAKAMGTAGRKKIKKEYNQRAVFARVEQEYQRFLKEKEL